MKLKIKGNTIVKSNSCKLFYAIHLSYKIGMNGSNQECLQDNMQT